MCVRTKNSYGCGHNYKETVECYSSRCSGIERTHFQREGDCRSCRAGGTAVTRGAEGKGRYAQEHKLRWKEREQERDRERKPLANVSGNDQGESQTSPWAASKPRDIEEKLWHSPTRQKADQLWLAEHAERQQSVSPRNSPRQEMMLELENDRSQRQRDETEALLYREIKKIEDLDLQTERRRQDRHNSYDSLHSVDIEERSPRSRTHSYSRRSHGDSQLYSYSSRVGSRTQGSYDSGFGVSSSPYMYGHTPAYDYAIVEPSYGYSVGYSLGHGLGGMVRDAGTKWKRF